MRKETFLFLLLLVCLLASLVCTTAASAAAKPEATAPLNASSPRSSAALLTQKLTIEPSVNVVDGSQQQGDSTVAPVRDQDNRQKASVATSASAPSQNPPAPPQRLRIIVIKN